MIYYKMKKIKVVEDVVEMLHNPKGYPQLLVEGMGEESYNAKVFNYGD